MTPAPPIPPPHTADFPPPIPTSPEPRRKGHALLWLVLGGLALLLAAGVATIVVLSGGEDEAAVVEDESALINDHNAEANEPALVDVPGYVYQDPAPNVAAEFDRQMAQSNAEVATRLPAGSDDVYSSWSAHEVYTTETDPLAMLMLMKIDPQFVSQPQFSPEMILNGLAGGMATSGGTVTTETIDGETVAVVEDPAEDIAGMAWYHEDAVCMAIGDDEDAVRAFAEAYITEQNN